MQELLTIVLQHDYYAEGQDNQLRLRANETTQEWLNTAEIQLQQSGNNVRLLAPEGFDWTAANEEQDPLKLTFGIESADPQFIVVTELPTNSGQALVFKNDAEKGLVSQSLSGQLKDSSVPTAAIELSFAKEDLTNVPARFELTLSTRTVAIRYYCIIRQAHDKLSLKGEGSELFQGPKEVSLPNGSTAHLFESAPNLFPINALPTTPLQVELSPPQVMRALPMPMAKEVQLEDGAVYIPIYTYL